MPDSMNAMVLERVGGPVVARRLERPRPGQGQILLRVDACGVCRTDLHISGGRAAAPQASAGPGPRDRGPRRRSRAPSPAGSRSVPGLACRGWAGPAERAASAGPAGRTCATRAEFTGYDRDGGYAEYAVADERYCFALPPATRPSRPRPSCARASSAIARSWRPATRARLGLYGFGAAAHIVAQVARHQGRRVFAFTRPGDDEGQRFARELGAAWAGGSDQPPPDRSTRRSSSPRSGDLVPGRSAQWTRAGGWSAPASTCRRSRRFRMTISGASEAPLGRQPDAARRRGVLPARGTDARSRSARSVSARTRQIRR